MSFTTDLSNKTTIFWDFENIPMNGILQATEFINWVKITCNGSINVICDTNRVQEDVRTYLRYLNVHLKDPHSKKNNSADITIINEVYRVVWTNKPPYRFCFITKDDDFAETISQLKEWGYEVWLLTNKNGHSNFLTEITSKTIFIPDNLYEKEKLTSNKKQSTPTTNKTKDTKIDSKQQVVEPFYCQTCFTKFKDKRALQQHNHAKHSFNTKDKIKTSKNIFICNYCGKKVKTEIGFQQHKKSKHTNIKEEKCHYCNRIITNKNLMLQHQKKEHHHYICFYCKQIYETQKDMDLHIRSIHSFICFYCKKVLRTKIGVENHIKALHEQTNTKIVQTIHHEEYSSETIDNSAYNADEWENLRAKRIQELREMEKDR